MLPWTNQLNLKALKIKLTFFIIILDHKSNKKKMDRMSLNEKSTLVSL